MRYVSAATPGRTGAAMAMIQPFHQHAGLQERPHPMGMGGAYRERE